MDVFVVHSAAPTKKGFLHVPMPDRLLILSDLTPVPSIASPRIGWNGKSLYYYTMCRHIVHRCADPCDIRHLGLAALRMLSSHRLHRRWQFPKPRRRPNGRFDAVALYSDLFHLEKWQGEHREC